LAENETAGLGKLSQTGELNSPITPPEDGAQRSRGTYRLPVTWSCLKGNSRVKLGTCARGLARGLGRGRAKKDREKGGRQTLQVCYDELKEDQHWPTSLGG